MDIGSQDVHMAPHDFTSHGHRAVLQSFIKAMGREPLPAEQFEAICNRRPVREVFDYLGISYDCIDSDGNNGGIVFDLNFDDVAEEHKGRFDFVANGGTTEHLINQVNAFRTIHDLTATGGLMFHTVPFLGAHEHGFFNYQPNFFHALARFNGYETLAVWINPGSKSMSLIPYRDEVLDVLRIDRHEAASLFVLFRKTSHHPFQIPFQGAYEYNQRDENLSRYSYVVDGELLSGRRVKSITQKSKPLESVPGSVLLGEVRRRVIRRLRLPFDRA